MFDLAPSPDSPRFALSKYDEVVIGDVSYRTTDPSERGHVFVRVDRGPDDAPGLAIEYSHDEIARRILANQMTVKRAHFLPQEAQRRLRASFELFTTLDDAVQQRARFRHALVEAAEEMRAEGLVRWTDASIKAALPEIQRRAKAIYVGALEHKRGYAGSKTAPDMEVSPRSLRAWRKAHEIDGLNGLVDRRSRSGRRAAAMPPEERSLMMAQVRRYATRNEPSKQQIRDDVERAFKAENEKRAAAGLPPFTLPKRHVIDAAIADLDPFHVAIERKGLEKAREWFAPVGEGLELTRPLQRVEMDEWQIDLFALLADAGLYDSALKEELERLELDSKKARFWLTVAICATTRVILAMKLSVNPKASVAVQTLEMILRDKQVFADAVGALSPWNMFGAPEIIVTDCGSAFNSTQFRAAITDLGLDAERTPGGIPHLRGRIERVFRTMGDQLMARLSGRTFGSLAARGDHDPAANAALSVEELCFALVRWTVDIYHNRPHDGLGGETPLNAWKRLHKLYGVRPAPDLRRRRLVFGTKLTRQADREGVVVCGVRYHSERLARWVAAHDKADVAVRAYAEDVGAVMVRLGSEWVEVPSVHRRFAGVSAMVWEMAARQRAPRARPRPSCRRTRSSAPSPTSRR